MTAYNKSWVDALIVKTFSKKLLQKQLLSESQYQLVKEKFFENFYTPNIFICIGLFFFTFILVSCSAALVIWVSIDYIKSASAAAGLALFLSFAMLISLEFIIKSLRHYNSGVDNAFLYIASISFVTGIFLIFIDYENFMPILIICLVFFISASIRYGDKILTILAFLCASGIIFRLVIMSESFLFSYMPFILFLFGLACYFFSIKILKKSIYRYRHAQMQTLKICCLLFMYLYVNLYFIKELYTLSSLFLTIKGGISFAFILHYSNILVPIIYLYRGIKKKDRDFIHAGLITLIFSIYTFYHFSYSVNLNLLLLLSGFLLVLICWLLIRYLKRNSLNFTFIEENEDDFNLNSEAILISQSLGTSQTHEQEMKFGGGEFGGAGAGGEY